jgi:DNA-binding transcriptional MerR regulator
MRVKRTYSTAQVARMAGVHKATLLRWLYAGSIQEPKRHSNGGVDARIWSDRDVQRVRKHKAAHYRKGRGRKKKRKA